MEFGGEGKGGSIIRGSLSLTERKVSNSRPLPFFFIFRGKWCVGRFLIVEINFVFARSLLSLEKSLFCDQKVTRSTFKIERDEIVEKWKIFIFFF